MGKINLKPCPFCGSDDITLWRNIPLQIVGGRCNNCGADSGGKSCGQTKQEAADAWNTRTPERTEANQ